MISQDFTKGEQFHPCLSANRGLWSLPNSSTAASDSASRFTLTITRVGSWIGSCPTITRGSRPNSLRTHADICTRPIFGRESILESSSQRLLTKNIRSDDLQLRSERSRSQMDNY